MTKKPLLSNVWLTIAPFIVVGLLGSIGVLFSIACYRLAVILRILFRK